jgi:hypothetical protein
LKPDEWKKKYLLPFASDMIIPNTTQRNVTANLNESEDLIESTSFRFQLE